MGFEYPFYVQERKFCVICENEVERFLPWQDSKANDFVRQFQVIGSDAANFTCPHCTCHDRERHLYLFMKGLGLIDGMKGKTVLITAPEMNFLKKIFKPEISFVCGDLFPENYSRFFNPVHKIDLTKLQFDNESMDVVIANHILEHIPNYYDALNEIYRVLKKGGYAVLQTPFSPMIYNNFEDQLLNTEELKEKFYGQRDHVRVFGLRLFDDIKQAGFDLHLYRHDEVLQKFNPAVYGVNYKENFILARK